MGKQILFGLVIAASVMAPAAARADTTEYGGYNEGYSQFGQGYFAPEFGYGEGWNSYALPMALSYPAVRYVLAQQGYFSVRDVHAVRYAYGWRACAQDRWGRPVVLRLDPFTGRVLRVRLAAGY